MNFILKLGSCPEQITLYTCKKNMIHEKFPNTVVLSLLDKGYLTCTTQRSGKPDHRKVMHQAHSNTAVMKHAKVGTGFTLALSTVSSAGLTSYNSTAALIKISQLPSRTQPKLFARSQSPGLPKRLHTATFMCITQAPDAVAFCLCTVADTLKMWAGQYYSGCLSSGRHTDGTGELYAEVDAGNDQLFIRENGVLTFSGYISLKIKIQNQQFEKINTDS